MAALEENGFHATDAPGALCGQYQLPALLPGVIIIIILPGV
jgi:hypothetical protein